MVCRCGRYCAYSKMKEDQPDDDYRLHSVCLPQSTHQTKLILKGLNLYHRLQPIQTLDSLIHIPLNLTTNNSTNSSDLLSPHHHFPSLPLSHQLQSSLIGYRWLPVSVEPPTRLKHLPVSPLLRALQRYFKAHLPSFLSSDLPSWESYDNFLLFQPGAFLSPTWTQAISHLDWGKLFEVIANEFHVTHLARKGYIHRSDPMRRPRLDGLYGDFGSDDDPQKAFWTSTRFSTDLQHIHYVWSPSHTMYCRGNASEKRRISTLSNVKGQVVVDLFSGIGFFTFPYLVAGAHRVIACEMSQWAVEGLRRGAIANDFSYSIVSPEAVPSSEDRNRLWIVPGANEQSMDVYRGKASHVNLGLLPSSTEFLPQALVALRPEGGWLHVHGEARRDDEADWTTKVLDQIKGLVKDREVSLVGLHRVKSMGPVLIHWVAQVFLGPPSQTPLD